jgi:hypothetical protein
MSNRADTAEEFVGVEVTEFNRRRAGAHEVQVKAGHVIQRRREGLAIAERIDFEVGDGLLLIRDPIRTGGRLR